jgi:hypothetical protein
MPVDLATIQHDRNSGLSRRLFGFLLNSTTLARIMLSERESDRSQQQEATDCGESNIKILHICDVHVSNT